MRLTSASGVEFSSMSRSRRAAYRSSASRLFVLLFLGTATVPAAAQCVLEYQRADNAWAQSGRPDGSIGTERLVLQPGQRRTFVTDWSYEKRRNDGTNYYGSHVRIVRNAGKRPILVSYNETIVAKNGRAEKGNSAHLALSPGQKLSIRLDVTEVECPAK